jgi:hypothetical protein
MAIITISRGTFSGGQALADCVAKRLGYRCINREALEEASREYYVPEERLSKALVGGPKSLERLSPDRARYLSYLRAILLKECRDEKLVYHGHAGHLLLDGVPHTIRVKIIANMESRIKALTDHHNVTRRNAIQYIKKVDQEKQKWTRFLYHVDWNDPSLYDFILNIDYVGFSGACDILCRLAIMERYRATAWSHKIIDDMALSSHVKASLTADRNIGDDGIEVRVDGRVVYIGGTVEWIEDINKVERTVSSIPGVEKVFSTIQARMSWGDVEGLRMR